MPGIRPLTSDPCEPGIHDMAGSLPVGLRLQSRSQACM
jgi:hypothetical protein